MKPETVGARDMRPFGNVIELPCSSASAQVIVSKRTPALAEGKRPPRYLPLLRRTFDVVPPAARLAVGLPLRYMVLTGIFLAWLLGLSLYRGHHRFRSRPPRASIESSCRQRWPESDLWLDLTVLLPNLAQL